MSVKLSSAAAGTVLLGVFLSPITLTTAAGQTGGVATFTNQSGAASTPVTQAAVKAAALAVDSSGWTVFKKSADTRVIYVSSSGDDRNDGLSESRPKRTIAAGYALLRHGYPDWLLLKAGDTWNEGLGHWRKSGRSATERMVVGTFGSSRLRPLMRTGDMPGFRRNSGSGSPASIDNLALVGLGFSAAGRSATSNHSGLLFLESGENILLEDCTFDGYGTNLNIQGSNGRVKGFSVRRCAVLNSFAVGAHSQGLYASKVDGLEVVDTLFDHNGYNESVSGAQATIFNHNVYVQYDSGPVKFNNNIVLRSSSHGAQLRSGGVVTGNLFARNPIGLLMGGGDSPVAGGVTATVKGNAFLEGTDIGTSGRGFGIDLKNISGGEVTGNLIANKRSANPAFAIGSWVSGGPVGVGVRNVLIGSNVIRNWRGGIQFNDPGSSAYAGVRVESNQLESRISGDTTPLVKVAVTPVGITFRLNRYVTADPRPFDFRGTRQAMPAWSVATGEAGAMLLTSTSASMPGSFEALVGKLTKRTLTFEEAAALLRNRSMRSWSSTVAAPSIVRMATAQ